MILIVFLLLVISAIALWFSPARSAFRSWRASSLLEEAQEYAENGEWDQVTRPATASMQNDPSVDALRLISQAAEKNRNPQFLGLVYNLYKYPGATVEDRAWGLQLAFDARDFNNATYMASLLTPEEIATPAIRFQLVRGCVLSGQLAKAMALADDASVVPRDPRLDVLIAMGLAGSGQEDYRDETSNRLRSALESDHRKVALEAMGLLVSLKEDWVHEPLAELALKRFQDDPDLGAKEQLQLLFLRIGPGKITRDGAIAEAVSLYRETELGTLVSWLIRLKEYQMVVDLTNESEVKREMMVFQMRLLALESLNEWSKLLEELESPPIEFGDPILHALRSLAAYKKGDESLQRREWQEAVKAAALDQATNWHLNLAGIAGRMGKRDEQMEAIIAGIGHSKGKPPEASILGPLFTWLQDRGESRRLL